MRLRTALAALVLAACRNDPPRPSQLFASRTPVEPLRAALRAQGGDPSRVVRVRALADLARLTPEARYKYAVLADGALVVAPAPADAPDNAYHHPVLAGGAPVQTAGYLVVAREGDAVRKVTVDQDSRSYCPTAASLAAARDALVALGLAPARVHVEDHPPRCVEAAATGHRAAP